ncbi:MAG: restriction endonuclease subunit S [Betaproteobacteria bacterium]|nr:restriction endonuclease subunit S [Betaproteobacteria bacterium]MCL2886867.1 restriction endonuclease subunit S [Betaproteobacteria bacterium]
MKPGYKLTEVGVIPEDWEVAPLGKYATFRTGPFGSALHQADYISNGIPVINPMHIDDGTIVPSETMTVSAQTANALSDFKLKSGEIVIGRRGDMGRCAVIREGQAGWLCGTGSMIIRPADANADYLQRILSSRRVITAIENASVGTTMVNLNQGTLSGLKIQFPPLPEQTAIATALSDMDALLGGLDRLIAKKRAIKQATMQQLLTAQTRLPGFSGEWEVKQLGNVGKCLRGVSYHGDTDLFPHDTEKSKRLLRSNNVQDAAVVTTDVQFVNSIRVAEHQFLQEGDVLICMANGSKALVGKAAYFDVTDGFDYTFGAFMGAFRITDDFTHNRFAFYLFQTWAYRQYIANLLAGSSINNLAPSSIESLEFEFPSIEEQTAIAAVLSDMDAEITALETRRNKTRALKQAMMQELLTGRTRLVDTAAMQGTIVG